MVYYVIEQIFHIRYELIIDYPAIKFFIKTKTPSRYLNMYSQSISYIEFNEDYKYIRYKKGFSKNYLKFKYWLTILGYGIFSMLGFGSVLLMPKVEFDELQVLILYLFMVLSLLIMTWLMLDENRRPLLAIELEEKHGINTRVN